MEVNAENYFPSPPLATSIIRHRRLRMRISRSSFPPATSTAAASFSLPCRCRRRRLALSPLVFPTIIPISCSRTSTRFGSSATATEVPSTRFATAGAQPCSPSRWSAPTSRFATRCSARSTSSAARLDAATSSDSTPSSELPPPTSHSSSRTWTGDPPTHFSAAAVAAPFRSSLWRPSLARLSSASRSCTPAISCTATSADFGVGKVLLRSLDPCDSYVGTCAYMSPERLDSVTYGADYDPYAADVWSLGLAVLELHQGHFPLLPEGVPPDWAALMVAICLGEAKGVLPEGVGSGEFRAFIDCCLRKESGKRWSVAELLGHPFVACVDRDESKQALRDFLLENSDESPVLKEPRKLGQIPPISIF